MQLAFFVTRPRHDENLKKIKEFVYSSISGSFDNAPLFLVPRATYLCMLVLYNTYNIIEVIYKHAHS